MKRLMIAFLIALVCVTTSFGFEVITVSSPAGPPKHWSSSKFPVGYSIDTHATTGISASAVSNTYNKVIGIINNQSPLKFKNLGTTSSVVAGDLKNGVTFDKNFPYGSGALAVQRLLTSTAAPLEFVEGDLVFNSKDYKFTLNATNLFTQTYNLFTIMLHEMGHSTGLQHSELRNAVMFFQYQKDFTTLAVDDKTGIGFIYKKPTLGTVPKLITPINSAVLSLSGVPSTSKFITFRWYKSTHATRLENVQTTSFSLVFAADSAFTKSVTRFNAAANQSYLIKGTPLSKLKTIQSASATGSVFWRIEENDGGPGAIFKSSTFSFKIN